VSKRALGGKKILQQNINAGARNVCPQYFTFENCFVLIFSMQLLEFINKVQESEVPEDAEEGYIDTPEVRAIMREAASVHMLDTQFCRLCLMDQLAL
jgi:hypothetical protein